MKAKTEKAQMKGESSYWPARLRVKVKLKVVAVHNCAPRFEDVWRCGGTVLRTIYVGVEE
jgi:hypothetical protein